MGVWSISKTFGNIRVLTAGLEARLHGRQDACRHDGAVFPEFEMGRKKEVRIVEPQLVVVRSALVWMV